LLGPHHAPIAGKSRQVRKQEPAAIFREQGKIAVFITEGRYSRNDCPIGVVYCSEWRAAVRQVLQRGNSRLASRILPNPPPLPARTH
jgi:hypothetical protein